MDAGTSISLRDDVLEKLKNALNDSSYRETIESSSNYNNRLVVERKTRIPFIDAQTGVAQNDCYLWMQKWERMPGITEGQLYSYPKKRWRKKKRSQYLVNNNYGVNIKQREKNQEKSSIELTMNGHETSTDNNLIDGSHESTDKFVETVTKEDWMTELDDVNDFNETLDNDEIESDFDEEYSSKKKKKKKNESSTGSGKKSKKVSNQAAVDTSSSDKPFKCDLCNMRYKTRPGLSYHYSHTHSVDIDGRKHLSLDEDDSQQSNSSLTNANGLNSRSSQISNSTSNSPLPNSFNQNNLTSKSNFIANNLPLATPVLNNKIDDKNKIKKATTPSSYCDFCLGNSEINKKTRTSEEMISCHHCGRSAHPTCLQFTAKMIKAVKTYPWECLECKSCGICGHSDNDDQLLFCDDCDRGYHSNCVGLQEIPEGEWICNLCIVEYHSADQSSVKNEPSTNNENSSKNKTDQTQLNKTTISSTTSASSSSSNNTNSDNLLNSNSSTSTTNSNNNSNKTSTNSHLKSDSKSPSLTVDTTSTPITATTNTTTNTTTTESTLNSDKS